jgi:hypothetical protein
MDEQDLALAAFEELLRLAFHAEDKMVPIAALGEILDLACCSEDEDV